MKTKHILILLLVLGIIHRFCFQFIFPAFNADEISLGNNIKHLSFLELLYPLRNYQSAPPLYLMLQKLVVELLPFKFWINIKLISFLVSVSCLYFSYTFIKKEKSWIAILLFLIFSFNPYIIYNTLTLKQYGFDLLGVLLLINFYRSVSFTRYAWLFFMIWCLLSNIGLFACAGYLIFNYFETNAKLKLSSIFNFIRRKFLIFLAPIPYIAYFIWYMQRDGAEEMKAYMVDYWQSAFVPFDSSIINFITRLLHELWICFYSAYEFWGITLLFLTVPLLYALFKRKPVHWKNELALMSLILCVHIFLNVLQLYPLSDRLFLYLAPFFILGLGSSLKFIIAQWPKYKTVLLIVLISITSITYVTYLSYKNNEVPALNSYIAEMNVEEPILMTGRVQQSLELFNNFTDNEFDPITEYAILNDNNLASYKVLISKVHTKIKPGEFSSEDNRVKDYLKDKKLIFLKNIPGYNIYTIK